MGYAYYADRLRQGLLVGEIYWSSFYFCCP